ncbi:probable salivary secreted peptide [Orussus abietinus]|uniref:probable salivary secreted peptide n=1 Tax=Orussus abietinus TaxID=222816 RepID=UPI000625B27A|nr:probable salivary secreted peptide [Orussus abietinus]
MQKYLFGFLFVAAVAIAANAVPSAYVAPLAAAPVKANLSHNLILGSRLPGDRLIIRENIIKPSKWLQVITVERTYNASKYERITQVKALDQKTNGNGAYATLKYGGPGNQNVTLKFKSQRGHGINFVVEIYARY